MLFPEGVLIDGSTGQVSPETGRYRKRLSELRGIFRDGAALEEVVAVHGDPVIYEVVEYKKVGSDLFFGTTTIESGVVGNEFYMTRGHFHERRDMAEIYYTQQGSGMLLLESRAGETAIVEMKPGICAFIPPDWAHRSINVGKDKLVFVWVGNVAAGHDYADILRKGMRKRVLLHDGVPSIVDNVSHA